VKITHSGVWGTDIHYHHVGIGMGHEGAGLVTQIGPEITNHKFKDKAAWEWVIPTSLDGSTVSQTP
jgi:Zn-dependent alcohol dehydrogenase